MKLSDILIDKVFLPQYPRYKMPTWIKPGDKVNILTTYKYMNHLFKENDTCTIEKIDKSNVAPLIDINNQKVGMANLYGLQKIEN